jgi:ketosteroid isomerase-like protein
MNVIHVLLVTSMLALPSGAFAQETRDSAAIVAVMEKSAVDWNRGDLDAFATCYKNSPDILFMSHTVSRGYAQMVEAYRKRYASREQMGQLGFSQLQVQPLDAHFATVTGHFHLEREKSGGGNSDGYFLLVFEKTADGWKIVRDDSTETSASPK